MGNRMAGHTVLMAGVMACLALTGMAPEAWAKQGKCARLHNPGYCAVENCGHPGLHRGHHKQWLKKVYVRERCMPARRVHVSGGRFPREINAWEFEHRHLPCIRKELERAFHDSDISGMRFGLDIRNGRVVGFRIIGYSDRYHVDARMHEHFKRLEFPVHYSGSMEVNLSYF